MNSLHLKKKKEIYACPFLLVLVIYAVLLGKSQEEMEEKK